MILTALVFFLLLSVLVLIHELGHFLVARKLNIKVEEFGFGLPPRIWGIKRGETIYSINWLPIGGFVKLFGEDEAGAGRVTTKKLTLKAKSGDTKRAFFSRSPWQRAAVVVAGVVMNTLLAIVLFYTYMFISGFKAELPLMGNHKFFLVNETINAQVVVSGTAKDSPAEKAGIPQYALLTAINGTKIDDLEAFTRYIKDHKGEEISLTWKDSTTMEETTKSLTPRVDAPKDQGAIGVSLFAIETAVLNYETPFQKIFSGIIHPANLISYNFDLIGQLIQSAIRDKNAAQLGEGVAGPVGIYSLVGTIVQIPDLKERVLQIINLAGILSISLAIFNVLPIPALDGGRLFFILIEAVSGKKVNQKYETLAHTIGMALLLTLIVLITFKDVFQFFL